MGQTLEILVYASNLLANNSDYPKANAIQSNMHYFLVLLILFFPSLIMADQTIVQSPVDEKQYRLIQLENELQVLLISDGDADKSAASLDVNIGNGSDPDEWGGLAHFLEHMLFLGTEKYPEAGEYQEFIKSNGGSNNAYTSFNHTNYYFSISPDHFEQGLDRFSRFFIDPTFDPLFVDRERSVVHSEYQARKKDEGRRLWDAQKKWLNPKHPASRFSVGSLETLRDREGASVRDTLIDFYQKNYSASVMRLAILGNQSLDQLEEWVVEKFSSIPNNCVAPLDIELAYFNEEIVPARLNAIPEKDTNSVTFQFKVPSTIDEYKSKPFSYIANLLGHEGVGSLHSILKSKGWAESLSAGPGYMDKQNGTFAVRIGLTEAGVDHIEEIGELLFSQIKKISEEGIQKWRFDEQKQLANISFRYAQERDPGNLVQSLASRMHVYDPEDLLRGPYMMEVFSADRIRELLGHLTPENMNTQVVSSSLFVDSKTEYYDVDYSLKSVDSKVLEQWKSAQSISSGILPENNPFIPERLELLENGPIQSQPQLISSDRNIDFWLLQDSSFGTPRANFYFNIMLPKVNQSPRNVVLTELYIRLVNESLNKVVYPAYLADVNYSLYRHGRGISARLSGYEDKQSELLEIVLEAMKNSTFRSESFDDIKSAYSRELRNVKKDSPSNQTVHEIYRLIMDPYWTESERLQELNAISVSDVQDFSKTLFEEVKVSVLSHGDVDIERSEKKVKLLEDLLDKSRFIDSVDKTAVRVLDRDKEYLRTMEIDHTDSALAIYYQGFDDTLEERARVSLLKALIESPFYNNLRTINRVGYLVHAGTVQIDQTPGLLFSVQSPSHSPAEIHQLISEFIGEFSSELAEMTEEEFKGIRQGLIDRALRKPKNLGEYTGRIWREIDLEELSFDTKQKFADTVSKYNLADMKEYFSKLLQDSGAELVVQSLGTGKMGVVDLVDAIVTGDPETFRNH